MKRLILLLCLLSGIFTEAGSQEAAVGVNTENPQGILHIDAASNNNPTGAVSAAQATDDVLIDADGQFGAGLAQPAAKVDIYADTPGGALRVQDGTQADGRALTSLDSHGVAAWQPLPQAPGRRQWCAFLTQSVGVGSNSGRTNNTHPYISYNSQQIYPEGLGSGNKTAGTVTVPFTGKYLISVSAYFLSQVQAPYWGRIILYVTPKGSSAQTVRWTPSAWGNSTSASIGPFFPAILELTEDDTVSLTLDATQNVNAYWSGIYLFGIEYLQP
jgi:phage terminase large subunit-like protein